MAERYFVAINALSTPPEVEAKALAADLGSTAYEVRLKLTAGFPAIVLTTVDQPGASGLLGKIKARGHRAQICHSSEVVAAADMISMKRFQLTADGLESGSERLPWRDIAVLVKARYHEAKQSETVKEKKFDLGRAVMTGGIVVRKTEQREVVTRNESTEQLLYIFRANNARPWLLREQSTNYSALGDAIEASALLNFTATIAELRKRAPHARFDDSVFKRPTITDVDLYALLASRNA